MNIKIEPDPEPRDSRFHKQIVHAQRIPGTKTGNVLVLECGHRMQSYGDLKHANGFVLCTECRDEYRDEQIHLYNEANTPQFHDARYQRRVLEKWRPIPVVENIYELRLECGHEPLLLGEQIPDVGAMIFCPECFADAGN